MRFGFSTLGCPDWEWDDILSTASDLGFDGIELRGVGKEIYLPAVKTFNERNLPAALAKLKRLNLAVPCLASGAFLFDGSKADAAGREVRDYIRLAATLGASFVRVLLDEGPAPGEADEDVVEANLRKLLPEAKAAGITLLAETNGIYAHSAKLRTLCDKLDHPSLGVLWDVHHPFRFYGEEAAQTYENLSRYIRHAHLKDSVRTNGRVCYRLTGEGDVPVSEALRLLSNGGFDGFVTLEWVKRWDTRLEEPGIAFPHFINAMRKLRG